MFFIQFLNFYFRPGPIFRAVVVFTQLSFTAGFSLAYLISPHFCHRYIFSQVPPSLPYILTLLTQLYLQLGSPQPTLHLHTFATGIFIAKGSIQATLFIHTSASGIFIARFSLAYFISPHFCLRYIYSQVLPTIPYIPILLPQVNLYLGSIQHTLYPNTSASGIFISRFYLA